MLQYKWENLTAGEFDEAIEKSGGLCILPMGCMERHGEHLGSGCDSIQARTIANAAAEKEYAVVFPATMWLGDVMGVHALSGDDLEAPYKKRGYIAPSPRLLFDVLEELCEEIHRNGFRKILILNGHGGNTGLLNFFVRSQCYEKKDYATMWTNTYPSDLAIFEKLYNEVQRRPEDFPPLSDKEMETLEYYASTGLGGGHGDRRETLISLVSDADIVRPDKYDACPNQSTGKADYLQQIGVVHGQNWSVNFPHALSGFSSEGCTQNLGNALLTYCSERLAHTYKVLKEDEKCVMMSQRKPF